MCGFEFTTCFLRVYRSYTEPHYIPIIGHKSVTQFRSDRSE